MTKAEILSESAAMPWKAEGSRMVFQWRVIQLRSTWERDARSSGRSAGDAVSQWYQYAQVTLWPEVQRALSRWRVLRAAIAPNRTANLMHRTKQRHPH